jgi:hypothetical protein
MRLKHYLFTIALLAAVVEVAMAMFAMHWYDILAEMHPGGIQSSDAELTITQSLNIVLPVGVGCVLLLLWLRRHDDIGTFTLIMLAALHFAGYDVNKRAVAKIFGDEMELARVAWWAPAQEVAMTTPES